MAGPHGLGLPPIDDFDERSALIVFCVFALPLTPFVAVICIFTILIVCETAGKLLLFGVAATALKFLEFVST
jgi:hypothetical protein